MVFIMGATAAGKTQLALELADRLPVSLISVDSALIYREMDIGTAKPDAATLQAYPHALIDIRDPSEVYSAAEFVTDAHEQIERAWSKNQLPVLVGGTFLYFKALSEGLAALPAANEELRAELSLRAEQESWPGLHAELAQLDPKSGKRLDPNDGQRILRALEVVKLTGRSITEFWADQGTRRPEWDIRMISLFPKDRAALHQRIADRYDQMLESGFQDEVQKLKDRGDLNDQLPSIRSVGYRQMWGYLEGGYGFEAMRDKALAATRQLAKRQITWMRSWDGATLLDPLELGDRLIDKTLRQIN